MEKVARKTRRSVELTRARHKRARLANRQGPVARPERHPCALDAARNHFRRSTKQTLRPHQNTTRSERPEPSSVSSPGHGVRELGVSPHYGALEGLPMIKSDDAMSHGMPASAVPVPSAPSTC